MVAKIKRRMPTISVLLLAASSLLLLVGTASATTGDVPKSGVIEVTGYGRVTEAASSDPVTVQVSGRQAAAIRKALSTLASTDPSGCVDTLEAFSIRFLPHKGVRGSATLVTENDCPTPGVVAVLQHGKAVATLRESCSLRAAVVAALPRFKAYGTRQDRNGCSS